MAKGIAVGLIIVGVVLLIWAFQASESFSSDVSRFFNDSPTDKTIWLFVGGVLALVAGVFGLSRKQN
jgi:hypothetical protein